MPNSMTIHLDNPYEIKTALLYAVVEDRLELLNELLEIPECAQQVAEDLYHAGRFYKEGKNSLLHVAIFCVCVYHFELTIFERLISIPSVMEHITENKNHALAIAVEHDSITMVKRLLKIPAVVEAIQANNNKALSLTPSLYYTNPTRALDMAQLLVENGADLNVFTTKVPYRFYIRDKKILDTDPIFKQKVLEHMGLADNISVDDEAQRFNHPEAHPPLSPSFYMFKQIAPQDYTDSNSLLKELHQARKTRRNL